MSTQKEGKTVINKLITEEVLDMLLLDRTTGENIIWATDDYEGEYGILYSADQRISFELENIDKIIKPRVYKDNESQKGRSKKMAEVFTPSWICNKQNNMVDNAWFGVERRRFNTEKDQYWRTNYYPIKFEDKDGKRWTDYVLANKLEISCGEAPYITSRYDTVSGEFIPVKNRVGFLDRKIRVVGENTNDSRQWIAWVKKAVMSTYGFEWQGDNLFLARKNILSSVIEAYYEKFHKALNENTVKILADIITWNIWQMDGITFTIPNTDTVALIKDWVTNEVIEFKSVVEEGR